MSSAWARVRCAAAPAAAAGKIAVPLSEHGDRQSAWQILTWTTPLSTPGTTPATTAGEVPDTADASIQGTAGELVLALYGRIPVDSLKLDGDRRLFDLLLAWDPDE
ncbi:hypothetical protein [Streptomyces sp. NPDC005141]